MFNYTDALVAYNPATAIADNTGTNYSVFDDAGSAGYSMGSAMMDYLPAARLGRLWLFQPPKAARS